MAWINFLSKEPESSEVSNTDLSYHGKIRIEDISKSQLAKICENLIVLKRTDLLVWTVSQIHRIYSFESDQSTEPVDSSHPVMSYLTQLFGYNYVQVSRDVQDTSLERVNLCQLLKLTNHYFWLQNKQLLTFLNPSHTKVDQNLTEFNPQSIDLENHVLIDGYAKQGQLEEALPGWRDLFRPFHSDFSDSLKSFAFREKIRITSILQKSSSMKKEHHIKYGRLANQFEMDLKLFAKKPLLPNLSLRQVH